MDDHDTPGFPGDWLEQQRRFWSGWAEGAGGGDLAQARAAWAASCDEWWREMAGAVPAPLAGPLKAALEQTRLCLALMGRAPGGGDQPAPDGDPAALFAAALDALGETPAGAVAPGSAEAAHLRAFQAYVDALAAIAHAGLVRVRERLAEERPDEPGAVYAIYAREIEAQYRETAAGESFARTVGDLVNSRIALLAARGEGSA